MTYTCFSVKTDSDGIAILTIDVPDNTMNVWNETLISEFSDWVDTFCNDENIKGVVICSGKENGFMAGADLKMMSELGADLDHEEKFDKVFTLSKIFRKLETSGIPAAKLIREEAFAKPVAVAVEGLALGGGLELVLAGHFRVAADNPKIKLGLPEVQVGLLPGAGGTQRTPRYAGLQNALTLATQGKPIDVKTAHSFGLISEIVSIGETIEVAKQWVKSNSQVSQPWDKKGFKYPGGSGAMDPRSVQLIIGANAMAQNTTKHNYPAVKAIMSSIYQGSIVPFDTALRLEIKFMMNLMDGDVSKNMIRSLFLNKQAAEKGAQRPKEIEKIEISKVAVIGGGLMGSGITHVTAKAGMQVIVLDRSEEEAQKAINYTKKILDKRVSRGQLTQQKADEFLSRINITADYEDIKGVDMVIEAVFERPDIKADVIKKVEAVIDDHVILATNTSTLPITELAKNCSRPKNFIGVHFFSPVERMPLIEIIPGEETGSRAIAAAFDYNSKIRKTPIVVKDVRGFFTNQVFPPYINEAMLMITEGIKPALIENAALQIGMPIGPLALIDETTLVLTRDVFQAAQKALGTDYKPSGTEDFVLKMVDDLGRGGRRLGAGIYDYEGKGGKRLGLWAGMTEYYPLLEQQPSVEDVKERLMYIQLIASVECFVDGVVPDAASADLGALFGWGFPAWTGGPLAHIDTLGLDNFIQRTEELAKKHGERYTPPAKLYKINDQGGTLY